MHDMTYKELKDLLKAYVQNWGGNYNDNIVKTTVELISLPQIARAHFWRSITKPYNKTLVVGTDNYYLPYDFDKFKYLKSKYGELTELDCKSFDISFADRSDSYGQDISFYKVQEYEGVQNQITTAEKINVVSSNSADTQTVMIRGEVSGLDDYEEVTLTGTTTATTTKTFSHIAYVTKSEKTLGSITISGNTSSTQFTQIPAEHLTAMYKKITFNVIPQEALELVGEYRTLQFRPQRDYDVIRIPGDIVFMHALSLMGWERRTSMDQYTMEKKYEKELEKAIQYDMKSHAIESAMELGNKARKGVSDGYNEVYGD